MRDIRIEPESNNQVVPPPETSTRPAAGQVRRRTLLTEEDDEVFVPHLLAQLEDELARSRRREAIWISIIVHIVAVLLIATSPRWLPSFIPAHIRLAEELNRDQQGTFITLPNDLQKPTEKPRTNKLSDKNRVAESRHPEIDRKTLEELSRGDQRAPGMRGAQPQPAPQPAPQQQPQGQNYGMQRFAPPPPPANSQSQQSTLEAPRENPFKAPGTAGDAIAQAMRNAPHTGSFGGGGGAGYGRGSTNQHQRLGGMEILSDTMGVDFGAYLARMHPIVQANWDNLMPESVRPPLLKHGRVLIRFFIMPNGTVNGMSVVSSSGDVALDRAAWGAIVASSPFPPLPREYRGPYLELVAGFFYNPTTGEMEQFQ